MAPRPRLTLPRWRWSPLDIISSSFCFFLLLFLLLLFTRLGDPLAASGRSTLSLSRHRRPSIDRSKFISLVDGRRRRSDPGDARRAPATRSTSMPCEDPRRNSQLSREMNFYRERHCDDRRGGAVPCAAAGGVSDPDLLAGEPSQSTPSRSSPNEVYFWCSSLQKNIEIWHGNMPYDKIADRKGHQGWMKKEGPYFIFPGGGTMFPDGAEQYIEKLGQHIPMDKGIVRTALDMGCGVQYPIQFFMNLVVADASYIIEVDRLLRPGGYLAISGPPVQWHKQEKEWAALQAAARALCYEVIIVEGNTVIWKKPSEATCLPNENEFGIDLCTNSDDPSEAWYFKLKTCVSKIPLMQEVAVEFNAKWPQRLSEPPARVSHMEDGTTVFDADTKHWAEQVSYYKKSLGVKLGTPKIRNIMDMNARFGGFAAALQSDPVWVMNIVPANRPRTLDVIYDRGLIGMYHDWCEPFSTYPRTYDFIHVVGIGSLVSDSLAGESRCHLVDVMVEMDRVLRPEGTAVIRDSPEIIDKAERVATAIRWKVEVHETKPKSDEEKILVATKEFWKKS
ncbi:uncharacterized protein A4U43_C01F17380 [Asparagus officinalis]|uniref:Methyltransferase n=1 Tax=Asparagus officinalis TaxID=4686 RepID=A0A5P1FQP1_ASPOF|nr:uncharacterized protein A4U43_C01F17380 [Asparagus officinalis]